MFKERDEKVYVWGAKIDSAAVYVAQNDGSAGYSGYGSVGLGLPAFWQSNELCLMGREMSVAQNDIFIEEMWDKYRDEYIAECNAIGHQGDGADFWVWLEDNDLIPADIYET